MNKKQTPPVTVIQRPQSSYSTLHLIEGDDDVSAIIVIITTTTTTAAIESTEVMKYKTIPMDFWMRACVCDRRREGDCFVVLLGHFGP